MDPHIEECDLCQIPLVVTVQEFYTVQETSVKLRVCNPCQERIERIQLARQQAKDRDTPCP